MVVSKATLELVGITREEYIEWCKENNFPSYKKSTLSEFFARIREGRIIRDQRTRKLINKHAPKKNIYNDGTGNGNENE